jgi:hypothetical protein
MPGTGGKARFQCDQCGRTLNSFEDLREHEKDCKGPGQISQPVRNVPAPPRTRREKPDGE